jgi:hypothetical protein
MRLLNHEVIKVNSKVNNSLENMNKVPDKLLHEGGLYEDQRDLITFTKKGFSITEKEIPQLTKAFNQA